MSSFSKVAGHNVNKSIVFLHTSNNQEEPEITSTLPFSLTPPTGKC